MFKVTVKQAARSRGIKTPYQLAKLLGVQDVMAGRLWKGEQLPTLPTLDRVCEAFNCEITELVKRVSGKKKTRSP